MRFSDSFLDEIRARIPVSEVVKQRIALKKSGREWRGLSPFNKEKTPSFFVNDQKGFYHDFSSGKSGDQFKFLMEAEGLSFPEAVERLANMAGLQLPKQSQESEREEQKRKSLHDVMELATQFFEAQFAGASGREARDYAARRELRPETIKEFRVGFAPAGRFALKEFLAKQAVSIEDMIATGLLIAGGDIPVPYDRFRDRLMIPIHDQRGRVIAFGGRALNPDAPAKYLNSPETVLFHKSSVVFNFHRARQPAHEDGAIVVVEGYLDAISVFQAGLKSVVATMGTAFTDEQIACLWRLSSEPIVCFDSDRAGIGAAYKSIDRILPLLKVGQTFRFSFIQGGKDPDDLVRNEGIEAFKSVLAGSLPLWDVLWERETAGATYASPDAQAALEQRFNAIVKTIKDTTVLTAYQRTARMQLANLFWQAAKSKQRELYSAKGLLRREVKIEKEGNRHGLQMLVLGLLVHYPEFLDEKAERVSSVNFSPRLEEFQQALFDLLIHQQSISVQFIYSRLTPTFYDVLEEIHGEKTAGRPSGHRLFVRFPILKVDPPADFISKCIDHFCAILRLEQILQDVKETEKDSSSSDSDRLVLLVRELHKQQELAQSADLALAEEASEIKRVVLGPTEYQRVHA